MKNPASNLTGGAGGWRGNLSDSLQQWSRGARSPFARGVLDFYSNGPGRRRVRPRGRLVENSTGQRPHLFRINPRGRVLVRPRAGAVPGTGRHRGRPSRGTPTAPSARQRLSNNLLEGWALFHPIYAAVSPRRSREARRREPPLSEERGISALDRPLQKRRFAPESWVPTARRPPSVTKGSRRTRDGRGSGLVPDFPT